MRCSQVIFSFAKEELVLVKRRFGAVTLRFFSRNLYIACGVAAASL
jgi:hypothetical protein